MKRIFFVAVIIVGLVLSSVSFGYSGGSGTAEDPYQIADANDLLALAGTTADYSKCFILTADIDMEGQVFTTAIIAPDTVAGGSFDGTAFTGTFDGNGHKISYFTINGGTNYYLGLFGQIGFPGSVKNLGLKNCAVSGTYYVGGLVGRNYGSISDCYSTGAVNGTYYVGGLVGENNYGSISNCYATGAVSGSSGSVGGLVGYNDHGNISNCYSTGTVSGSPNSTEIGGLVGDNYYGTINNCYSTGAVSGFAPVGGLVGINYGTISNCYSTGSVSGSYYVGGLVGMGSGSVSSSYFLIISGPNNGYGTPLTDAQMKQESSFVGWDFTTIWGIQEGQSYPVLIVFTPTCGDLWHPYPPGDANRDCVVNLFDLAILTNNWLVDNRP